MAKEKLTPLSYILVKLDLNLNGLANGIGISTQTIYSWKRKGGNIPSKYHNSIIRYAKERASKMVVTADELMEGGRIKDE